MNIRKETVTNTSISVKWEAPMFDGNSPITNYTVSYKLENNTTPMVNVTKDTTINLIGLIPAQKYEINIFANNYHFSGYPSNITVVTADGGMVLQFSFESFLPSCKDGTYLCCCLFLIYIIVIVEVEFTRIGFYACVLVQWCFYICLLVNWFW